jgi:hypothetical protein
LTVHDATIDGDFLSRSNSKPIANGKGFEWNVLLLIVGCEAVRGPGSQP